MATGSARWRDPFRDPGVRNTIGWASGVTFLAGVWLIVSSFLFGPFAGGGSGAWNSLIVGVVIAALAAWRASAAFDEPAVSWVNAVLGAWMIAAPFVLGYTTNPARTWSSIIAGFVVVIFASQSATATVSSADETYTTRSAYEEGTGVSPYVPYTWPYILGGAPFGPSAWFAREPEAWRHEDVGQYRGRGPRGWRRTDDQIRSAVAERMADHPGLDASDIELAVVSGVVTLQGAVPTRAGKRLAEDIAESVGGVQDVHNELQVRTERAPNVRRAA